MAGQEQSCFVCDGTTRDGQINFTKSKSQHSGHPLLIFIRKFLRTSILGRDLSDPTNCICGKCLSRINEYDEICVKAKRIEDELHKMLLKCDKTWKNRTQPDQRINEENLLANESDSRIEDREESVTTKRT